MKKNSYLGIWMDHSSAHIMEFANGTVETNTVDSDFTREVKDESRLKGEKLMHNKEQEEQWAYYRKLGKVIERYTDVLLFGPTDAKKELFNILKANHAFENIKIDLKQSEKMSENQEQAFVKMHFAD